MCSIIASFSRAKIKELAALNAYRGQHSHSVTVFSRYSLEVLYQYRGFGALVIDDHSFNSQDVYIVAHQQAPTTDNKNAESIHPAKIGNQLLWHNGIVKDKGVKELQKRLESTSSWDTKLILQQLINEDTPDNIDGTFSCMWYDGSGLLVFRNEISPLFIDDELNISSTKFEGSRSISPNMMYILNTSLGQERLEGIKSFQTVENPYYFG